MRFSKQGVRNDEARRIADSLLGASSPRAGEDPLKEAVSTLDQADRGSHTTPLPQGIDYRRASMFVQWLDRLLVLRRATANALVDDSAEVTSLEKEESPLLRSLVSAHRMLMTHPTATKSVYRALRAEGLRFAQSEEGALLKSRLEGSTEVRRAAMVWRTLSLDMFDDEADGELPSTYLDHLLRVIDLENPAALLSRLFGGEESK